MQLIVAGFHRSGTSLLGQLLLRAGLFLGDDLLGAMPSNPYGHAEDREFLRLHRAITESHGLGWQQDSAFGYYLAPDHWRRMRQLARRRDLAHAHWGFKDPRACLLLGAWKHVLPDARVLVLYRDPGECVRSLEARAARNVLRGTEGVADNRRFFTEPDHGLRLWDTYNRALLSFARAHRDDCLVLSFGRLVAGFPVTAELNRRFGADLAGTEVGAVLDADAAGRRTSPQRYFSDRVADRVAETWRGLEALAEPDPQTGAA